MVESLKTDHPDKSDAHEGFKEQRRRRRKRSSSVDQAKQTNKAAMHTTEARGPQIPSQLELPTHNFFVPLRTAGKELDATKDASNQTNGEQQQLIHQRGWPPPIILTSAINFIQLQKQLKGLVEGSFEFQNIRNGTIIVNKEMEDFSAVKDYLNSQNLIYFIIYPNSCHMPCPSHPLLLDHTYLARQIECIMKLLVMQFSPPRHFIPLQSKCSPLVYAEL
jgi:hypothetical protein